MEDSPLVNSERYTCEVCKIVITSRYSITLNGPCPNCGRSNRWHRSYGSVDVSLLEQVALHYRDALGIDKYKNAPTKYVAVKLGTARSTAARWVMKARAAELLGAAVGSKAGEAV